MKKLTWRGIILAVISVFTALEANAVNTHTQQPMATNKAGCMMCHQPISSTDSSQPNAQVRKPRAIH